jgi:carbamoyl-phosphate synthase large subunit
MTTVLVTGAGAVLGQGIIKSIRSANIPCAIVAADPNPLSVGLYWSDQAFLVPMANDPGFPAAIEHLLGEVRPDVVFVGTDVELGVFASRRAEWEARFGTRILVSSPEIIEIADDKYATARFLAEHGLDFPISVLPEDKESLDDLIDSVGFPLIVKPRRGARAVGVSLVRNRSELEQALAGRTDLVVQELAGPDDQEYTAGVLFFDDEVQASIVLRRDLRDGNTHRAFVGDYPDCEEYVHAVARALKPFGPANFQFRKGRDGRCRLFEINARFSGTTPMRALAGFNEVELCLQHLLHGQAIRQPAIQPGVILRFLEEQFVPQSHLMDAGA